MNSSIAKALLMDAVYQVLDNRMFRFLVVLSALMVLPTFIVGIHEDKVSILFGVSEISYQQLFGFFQGGSEVSLPNEPHIQVIQFLQSLFVEYVAGWFGILFTVAATSFFLPQMLEKGAADTVFSKPVSRATLLLARYFSGILFTTILATLMVLGMHLGLTVISGYSDPGFLWSIPTLVYLFALVHSFSCCIAVLTRSSVMAILCTLMMYVGTGCVHSIWSTTEALTSLKEAEELQQDDIAAESEGTALGTLRVGINVLHYALPKTSDADVITRKLRRAIESEDPHYVDGEIEMTIPAQPHGFTQEPAPDIAGAGVVWVARAADGSENGRITLTRYDRGIKPGERSKPLSSFQKRKAFLKALNERDDLPSKPRTFSVLVGAGSTNAVRWNEETSLGLRHHEEHFFVFGSWMLQASVEAHHEWFTEETVDQDIENFFAQFKFAGGSFSQNPTEWFDRKYSWTAPLKYNLFFSIGSSLAFAALMLFIGWFKLSRADF